MGTTVNYTAKRINEDMAFTLDDCIKLYNAGLAAIIEDGEIVSLEMREERFAC